MSTTLTRSAALAILLAGGLVAGSQAAEEVTGNWIARAGVWGVFPKSNNMSTPDVDVDSAYSLGGNITYMATPQFGIEAIVAWPFKHDIELGGKKVGETTQLPPTLFLQYHFMPNSSIRPYAGIGLNYTYFWDEETTGALKDSKLSLDSSWGLAGELGVDIDIAPGLFVNGVVSYMDIDAKAKLDGAALGTVHVDPWVLGLNIGTRF